MANVQIFERDIWKRAESIKKKERNSNRNDGDTHDDDDDEKTAHRYWT